MSVVVHGIEVDDESRCVHFRGPTDIIAIRMKCCGEFYACKDCHIALANHAIEVWSESEWHNEAILCGACKVTLSIAEYFNANYECPRCRAAFNPRCRNHYHFYFESDKGGA